MERIRTRLTGDTTLVVSQNLTTSVGLNSLEPESEAKGLKNQKPYLNSRLKSKKHKKLERHQRIHRKKQQHTNTVFVREAFLW